MPSSKARKLRRAINTAAEARQKAWRDRERQDAYRLTVDLNGRVGAREASDLAATDARGDAAYLRERSEGRFADLRKEQATESR